MSAALYTHTLTHTMASPYEPVLAVLNVPENRIKYCYEFMRDNIDPQMRALAFARACEYIALCDESESHF